MSDFQQHALTLAAQQSAPEWLSALRTKAAADWQSAAWPTRKTEHWKYTNLAALQKNPASAWANASQLSAELAFIPVDATRLVFIDGVFSTEHSSDLPENVVFFSSANAEQKNLIQQHVNKVVEGSQHLFAALNTAWLADGILIHAPKNQRLEKPVYIVQVVSGEQANIALNQRVLVVLEASSQAEVIEHYVSAGSASVFANALTEIDVGENAELQHYRLNMEDESVNHIGGVHADLHRNARLRGFALALGGVIKRIDYQLNHRGQGASLDLQGIYLPRGQQMVDYHTNVQHWVPHCTSNEVFRGIVSDSAQAIFNGRIYIHPNAQKTLAELSNKNLLTSNKAEVCTKPELEIYADDVKCAHGATISQLNDTAIYYLQSRGVSRAEAEVMMSFGFINELLQQIPEVAIHDYLLPRLAALFGRDQAILLAE